MTATVSIRSVCMVALQLGDRGATMRVLITWGSRRGGTESIAMIVAQTLEQAGYAVSLASAHSVRDLSAYGAVVIGGALYANR